MILDKNVLNQKLADIEKLAEQEGNSLLFELEKLLPHAPLKSGVDMFNSYILDTFVCPKCASPIGDELMYFARCPRCGQRIKP